MYDTCNSAKRSDGLEEWNAPDAMNKMKSVFTLPCFVAMQDPKSIKEMKWNDRKDRSVRKAVKVCHIWVINILPFLFSPFLFYSILFYSILFYSHLMYYRPLLHLVSSILLSSSSPNLIWSHQYHHIQYRILKYSKVQSSIIRYDKKQCNAQDSTTEHKIFKNEGQ